MDVTFPELRHTYLAKPDDDLLRLHGSGTLSEIAYRAIEAELARRKIPIPPRAQFAKPASDAMTAQDRAEVLKWLIIKFSWFPALAIAAPIVNVYFKADLVWVSLPIMVGPMILMVRGVKGLLVPAENEAKPHAIILGGASAALLLCLAPVSIKVAMKGIGVYPSWIVLSLTGTAASVGYLSFAWCHWRSNHSAP